MWIWKQKTGILLHDEEVAGSGYSGTGLGKNNPSWQHIKNTGPIPQGLYNVGAASDTPTHGPHVLPLYPSPENNMFGRSEFLIHGDSKEHPGTASRGCIILPRFVRELISESGDLQLTVTA